VVRVEVRGKLIEIKHLTQTRVEEAFFDTAEHIFFEVGAVQLGELIPRLVLAENTLVDGLEQQTSGNDVECRVIFDVLQCHLDDGLIELLSGDAIEQRDFEFSGNLGYPRDAVIETSRGVFNRQVDLIGVIRLTLAIALNNGDG